MFITVIGCTTRNRGVLTSILWRLRPHHCLANSKNFHDHVHLDFQDFSGPGNFTKTIPGLSGRCGNAASTCTNTVTTECIQMNPASVFFSERQYFGISETFYKPKTFPIKDHHTSIHVALNGPLQRQYI